MFDLGPGTTNLSRLVSAVQDEQLDRVDSFLELFGGAPFGPAAESPADADRRARTVARTGRDPQWSPAG